MSEKNNKDTEPATATGSSAGSGYPHQELQRDIDMHNDGAMSDPESRSHDESKLAPDTDSI